MANNNTRYWFCIIGAVDENKLKSGSDFPLRMAVQEQFEKMFHTEDYSCWSGWGNDQEQADLLNVISSLDKDNPLYAQIVDILIKGGY